MTDLTLALLGRMAEVARRYDALTERMASPDVLADPRELERLGREQAALAEPVAQYHELLRVREELGSTRALLESETDDELRALAREEIDRLERRHEELARALKEFLHPRDPNDNRDVIVEIRAGTGGEEASLFAADLFRTYVRYAESRGWKVEVLSTSESDLGGLREVIFEVIGRGAYSRLKYESGVHRVQRVPETEAQGRIHTSTATVAVLPEPEELDVTINPSDLRIDVFRSSGHGGQSVNTTDSAVRITHLPTGIVVSIQDEKSQLKNKNRALAVLRARLYERERQRAHAEQDEVRRAQVGTGERAEKIRTYNFPQNRVTDHRINLTLYNLEGVMAGELDPIIDALVLADEQRSNGTN